VAELRKRGVIALLDRVRERGTPIMANRVLAALRGRSTTVPIRMGANAQLALFLCLRHGFPIIELSQACAPTRISGEPNLRYFTHVQDDNRFSVDSDGGEMPDDEDGEACAPRTVPSRDVSALVEQVKRPAQGGGGSEKIRSFVADVPRSSGQ
jgi:hypothetical protein